MCAHTDNDFILFANAVALCWMDIYVNNEIHDNPAPAQHTHTHTCTAIRERLLVHTTACAKNEHTSKSRVLEAVYSMRGIRSVVVVAVPAKSAKTCLHDTLLLHCPYSYIRRIYYNNVHCTYMLFAVCLFIHTHLYRLLMSNHWACYIILCLPRRLNETLDRTHASRGVCCCACTVSAKIYRKWQASSSSSGESSVKNNIHTLHLGRVSQRHNLHTTPRAVRNPKKHKTLHRSEIKNGKASTGRPLCMVR